MADDPAHRGRSDVRAVDPFQDVRAQGGSDYSMGRYTSELKRLYEVLEKRLGEALSRRR